MEFVFFFILLATDLRPDFFLPRMLVQKRTHTCPNYASATAPKMNLIREKRRKPFFRQEKDLSRSFKRGAEEKRFSNKGIFILRYAQKKTF